MTAEACLEALADSTRRALLERLATSEHSVRELTDTVSVTQSAVSQHLRVLREAGLVTVRKEGNRHFYRADPDGLRGLRAYVASLWEEVLDAYAAHAEGGEEP